MAKKSLGFNKKQKQWLLRLGRLPAVLLLGLLIGYGAHNYLANNQRPKNLVWAADQTVSVPSDLISFLSKRDDCKNYRGLGTVTGIGLWSVYQVEKAQF